MQNFRSPALSEPTPWRNSPAARGVRETRTPTHAMVATQKERAASRRPLADVSRKSRSERQRPTLGVPTERSVAESGESEGHHCPSRGLRNPRANAEFERIACRGERCVREGTKASNRNQL